jgi:hypothetical protein
MRHTANRPTLLASTDDITFPLVYDRRLPLPQQQCMQDDSVSANHKHNLSSAISPASRLSAAQTREVRAQLLVNFTVSSA